MEIFTKGKWPVHLGVIAEISCVLEESDHLCFMLATELKNLSKTEKLLLINDLWDDVAQDGDAFPLTPREERMLDERYGEYLADPDQGKSWTVVKEELRRKNGF